MFQAHSTVAEREYSPRLSSHRASTAEVPALFVPTSCGQAAISLLRATVAADLDRSTTQVSGLLTEASDASLVHRIS
jgi:hypothetical protein